MRRRALVVALTVSLLLGLAPAANAAVTVADAPQRSRCQGQLFNYAIRWNGRGSAAYKVEVLKPPRYGFRMTARYDRGYSSWSWGRRRVKRYTTKAAQLGVYQTTVSKRNLRGTRWVKRVYRTRVRDCR